MGNIQNLVKNEFEALRKEVSELEMKLTSPNLNDEERALNQMKATFIATIFDFLAVIKGMSPRYEHLFLICLKGGRCSSKVAVELGYADADEMRYARNKLMFLLSDTILNSDKVKALIESRSETDLTDAWNWYLENVFQSKKLIRDLSRGC